jgi:hypothetical protein
LFFAEGGSAIGRWGTFLKKEKLLPLRSAPVATRAPESKSFLVLFFKKELLPSLPGMRTIFAACFRGGAFVL